MRRGFVAALATACTLGTLAPPPAVALSNQDAMRLENDSKNLDAYQLRLGMGIKALDLVEGRGPAPQAGERVYAHYKAWVGGFDAGLPIEASYYATRPRDFVLGDPANEGVLKVLDAAAGSMREGGWRRLIVPPGLVYADGLAREQSGNNRPVAGGQTVYVDVRLMDGGSGRCDQLLRVEGFKKSVSCERGKP